MSGHVHIMSMSMVERHLKSLKDFVRQRSCYGGSMIEGYMVCESFVYISEYLPKVISMCLTFGMSIPFTTNMKGKLSWGKVEI